MKLNRKWLLLVALVLSVAMATTGTLAYLTDEDADVNTMTLGKVSIVQNEQKWNEDKTELIEYKNDEPLYPYIGKLGWTQPDPAKPEYRQFTMKNVQDKYVTVTNTGKSDAYVRTIIAAEMGGYESVEEFRNNIIGFSRNVENGDEFKFPGTWVWEDFQVVELEDGNNYLIMTAVHQNPVKPEETTIPSLLQVYMNKECDNEEVEKVDGNKNGKYDIIVLSQAIQVNGFEDVGAATALNEGFGATTKENVQKWFKGWSDWEEGKEIGSPGGELPDGWVDNNPPEFAPNHTCWNGTADTEWYNDTDTEFVLTTPEQLAGLAELVDGGNTFAGKTVKLGNDICLGCEQAYTEDNKPKFNPIGHSKNGKSFNGTFDGQENTISDMYLQSNLDSNNGGWLYEGEYYALFAYTEGATIKNLTMEDAYISSGRNEGACVAGNANNTTFENINIENATVIIYNNSGAAVAAECYGTCTFTDVTVDEDTVVGPLWGTYDSSNGGVVGMIKSSDSKVTFKNVDVACKIDAINDVASNYQYWLYRYSGMLIGKVDAVNGVANPTGYVTCENVTVTYGDWMNYHYCEDAALGAGSYNGPGEYKFARVEAGTGTNGIDLSTCNHNEDESHNVLIVFDQLFGGGQGVKGLKTYDGVTVKYPAGYVSADD